MDEEGGLENLFVCEDYVERSWDIRGVEQRLLCSNMSSTDHDLTGQIVWPASIQLCHFLYSIRDSLHDKTILELGAGCGLAGFFASKYCRHVLITDGNDVVLRLLAKNKKFLDDDPSSSSSISSSSSSIMSRVSVEKLLWGSRKSVDLVLQTQGVPDMIIGADVVLWPDLIRPLLATIVLLLFGSTSPSSVAYISYVVRAKSTTELLLQTAAEMSLLVEIVPLDAFLAEPLPSCLVNIEKLMLKISMKDKGSVTQMIRSDWFQQILADNDSLHYDLKSGAC